MSKSTESKRVSTLNVSAEDFKKIDITNMPKEAGSTWEYNQGQDANGNVKHSFKLKWKMDLPNFEKEILPSLDKKTVHTLAMSSWVIDEQNRQKAKLAQFLGIVGSSSAEQKALLRAAQRMVQRKKAKTIEEALEMIS
jgi:hypothetical protein